MLTIYRILFFLYLPIFVMMILPLLAIRFLTAVIALIEEKASQPINQIFNYLADKADKK